MTLTVGFSYTDASDEQLLSRVVSNDTKAFNEIYDRYGQKMFGYFYKMLWKNKELAEDQVQELFIKLMKHAAGFDTQLSFSTWLYSIAHNMCKNEYRKAEVRMKQEKTVKEAVIASGERAVDLRKFRLAVSQCISDLPEEKRSLFVLRFQEHLSVPEISQVLNIPEGTIKSRLFYLLKEMKTALSAFKNLDIYP